MKTRTKLFAAAPLMIGACWLLNLATASDLFLHSCEVSSEAGDPLSSPVNISFKLSETSILPDTTSGKLPEGRAHQFVESAMTVGTDGLNRIELKLKDGRKVAFEFRVGK